MARRTIGARFMFNFGRRRVKGVVAGWQGDRSVIEFTLPGEETSRWAFDDELEKGFTISPGDGTVPSSSTRNGLDSTDQEQKTSMSETTTTEGAEAPAPKNRAGRKAAVRPEAPAVAPKHIKLKVEANPKREGSDSARRFNQMMELVASGVTSVEDVIGKTDYSRLDLSHDTKKGFIEIVEG